MDTIADALSARQLHRYTRRTLIPLGPIYKTTPRVQTWLHASGPSKIGTIPRDCQVHGAGVVGSRYLCRLAAGRGIRSQARRRYTVPSAVKIPYFSTLVSDKGPFSSSGASPGRGRRRSNGPPHPVAHRPGSRKLPWCWVRICGSSCQAGYAETVGCGL